MNEENILLRSTQQFIKETGELGAAVYAHISDYDSGQLVIDAAYQMLEENYCGEYNTMRDFAEHLYNVCYDIPEHLEYYIDYDALARDLFLGDYFALRVNGKLHIFRDC